MTDNADPAGPLGRYLDGKLSRGLVRQETRKRSEHQFSEATEVFRLVEPLFEHLGSGRRIDAQSVRTFALKVKQHYGQSKGYLRTQVEHHFNPMLRNKSYAKVSLLQLAERDEGLFGIESHRHFITPDAINVVVQRAPITFTSHLAQRILERRRSEITTEAVASVANSLVSSIGLIGTALRAAYALPERRLAIPFEEGMILGEVREADEPMFDSARFTRFGIEDIENHQAMTLSPWTKEDPFDVSRSLTFRGATFIGEREMAPQQRALRDHMRDLRNRHLPAFDCTAEMILWPVMPGFMQALEGDGGRMQIDERLLAYDAVESLLSTTGWTKAMGNSGVARPVPMSMRDSMIWNTRMWRDDNHVALSDAEIDEEFAPKGP